MLNRFITKRCEEKIKTNCKCVIINSNRTFPIYLKNYFFFFLTVYVYKS